jgi:rhodanese-related sulfurtransferase
MSVDTKTTTRRWLLGAGAVAVVGGGTFAATWFNIFADAAANGALSVEEANQQAQAGTIYLIDIRRPDEWQRTGVATSAIPIDMRRKDFEDVLQSVLDSAPARPVALICARGVRSVRMGRRLAKAGFIDIINVPEGMVGSGAGAGWVAKKLPLRSPTEAELNGQISV